MRKILTLILLAMLLPGCGFRIGVSEEDVLAKKEELEKMSSSRIVTVHKEPYMGASPVKIRKGSELSAVFERRIDFNERGSLAQICASISAETGLPISIQGFGAVGASTASGASLDAQLRAALNESGPAPAPAASEGRSGIRISYSGTVKGLLDVVGSRFAVSWEYDAGSGVTFASANVKTFTIWAAPGKVTFSNKITNESKDNTGGASSSSGGTSIQDSSIQTAQSNTTDLSFDIWKDVETEVKSMLTASGSVTINQAAGTITVRDTPFTLRQVGRYVDDLNERLSRQIALSVKVWSLEVDDSTDVGIDLSLFFENADVKVFAGASPLKFLGTGGELSAAVVDGKLKNSTALLKGLRSIGNATQVTSGGGVVMSNQPVPVQAIRRDAYLASSERSQNEYGDTTSMVPGEVTTGFAMTVIPHIMENRRVVLQYSVNLSSLDELSEFSSGDSTIQLPKVSTRSFAQRMTIKMGQTLVLAGFEQEVDGRSTSGGFLGFGKSREYKKSLIIITISTESGDV